ncbi:60S ribosomal protein L11 [Lemmus lemmus]
MAVHCIDCVAKVEEILEKGLKKLWFGAQSTLIWPTKSLIIGIYRLGFYVVLGMSGFIIIGKKHRTKRLEAHRVSKEEAICWFQQKNDESLLWNIYLTM